MATTITQDIVATLSLTGKLDLNADLLDALETIGANFIPRTSFAHGTGSGQANEVYAGTRALAATSETLNIQDGSLTNGRRTFAFTKIKAIGLRCKSVTTGQKIAVTGDFVTTQILRGTSPILDVHAGAAANNDGWFWLTHPGAGWTVTATSADQITIDSGAATLDYDIILIGTV